jgi:hypothetical protein
VELTFVEQQLFPSDARLASLFAEIVSEERLEQDGPGLGDHGSRQHGRFLSPTLL